MDTTEFFKQLELAIAVPTYQPRFTLDDQLALAYDEQKLKVVPLLLGVRQNFLLVDHKVSVAEGTKTLRFPARAVARSAKNLFWFASDELGPQELTVYKDTQLNRYRDTDKGTPMGVTLLNDSVRFWPIPDKAGQVLFQTYCKPSKPVQTKRTATIRAVGVNTITVSSVPSNLVIGSICDLTRAQPGYELIYLDKTITNIAGTVITLGGFDADNPISGVSVGDSLSLAGETSILQMPEEAADVLAQATAVRILHTLGVPDQLKMAQDLLNEKMQNLRELIEPRVEDQPDVLFFGHPLLGGWTGPLIPKVTVPE